MIESTQRKHSDTDPDLETGRPPLADGLSEPLLEKRPSIESECETDSLKTSPSVAFRLFSGILTGGLVFVSAYASVYILFPLFENHPRGRVITSGGLFLLSVFALASLRKSLSDHSKNKEMILENGSDASERRTSSSVDVIFVLGALIGNYICWLSSDILLVGGISFAKCTCSLVLLLAWLWVLSPLFRRTRAVSSPEELAL